MKKLCVCLLSLSCAATFAAMPKGVLYVRGEVKSPEVLFKGSASQACTLAWSGKGEKPVLALDMGAPSVGGYAVFEVRAAKGRPTLRLAYANHPDGLGEKGCFARESSARYLGPDFDIPVLPGNINRHEIYSIGRTGLYVAPLIQGQERYVRVQLDTPGEVSLGSLRIVNADVFSSEPRRGSFRCSDDRLTRLWDISVWTCQLASFPNHDAWRLVAGRLLPRKLEQAEADCWRRQPAAADGTLRLDFEFDANPHFPVGTFEILVGEKRIAVKQDATNEVRHVEVPVKKGDRIGLSVPKESWPVVWNMTLDGESLMDLAGWDYARTLPYIADGAKRDRLIWSGDLWWAERNMFYAFGGESPYMKGSVKMLAFNRTPEGYVHASPYAERSVRPPTGDYGPFGSDEFAAWFVPVTWDFYLYTADRETLREVWPDVAALMRYLNAHRRGDGIFEQRKETCKHAAGLQFGGTSLHHRSYMNILLWKTLEDAASIAAALRHDHEAAVWRADAARFADVVRKTFWDEKGGFFRLSSEDGNIGFEANALALAVRFATQQEAARIMPQLKYNGHGKFQALAARGKFEYGDTAGGLKALEDHHWYKLLDPSWKGALTVTECMALHRRGWGDESHPDTAIAGIYSSYILGIVPLTPGYERFSFRPQTDGLTFAEGSVPTYFGAIRARWEKKGDGVTFTITVPQGTTAEFAWRDQHRILTPGTHTFFGAAGGGELTVAPGGLTPHQALDKVRAAKAAGDTGAWTIRVMAGVYALMEPLVFTPADSGTKDSPVTWIGEGEKSMFTGGERLTEWKDVGGGVWSVPVPRAPDGSPVYFEQLWVNGRRADRARLPNRCPGDQKAEYFNVVQPKCEMAEKHTVERVTLTNDAAKALATIPADELPYAQMNVIHKWSFARRILRGVDPDTLTVETHGRSKWTGWQNWNSRETLVWFENVRPGFDAPGEWFYDAKAGTILYRPMPGEEMSNAEVVAPTSKLSRLVEFKGDPDRDAYVHDIAFKNIAFAYTDAISADGGRGPTQAYQHQAACDYDGAVTAEGVRRLVFDGCTFEHTGNYGMRFNDGCVSNAVVNCQLFDLGAGGVWMGAAKGYVAKGETLTRRIVRKLAPRSTAFNRIENCVIRNGGRFDPEGTGVAYTHVSDSKVLNCEIYDFYYTGVSVGWTWGFAGSVAQRNEIAFNKIYDLGKGIMSDMGGVYTLGTSYGTRVHHNVIHDVCAYSYGGWALYTDEGSEGLAMDHNLCWNTTDGGFHQHYGAGCVIRNNIFAWNHKLGAVRMQRQVVQEIPCTLNFVNNIVVVRESPLVGRGPRGVGGIWACNLWYDYSGKKPELDGLDWEKWRACGKEAGGVYADPLFENAAANDFRLKPGSPALALGFEPWDYSVAGLRR